MKKLGNARALDTASLLGGLMRDHWVSMFEIRKFFRQRFYNKGREMKRETVLSKHDSCHDGIYNCNVQWAKIQKCHLLFHENSE